MTKNGAEPYVLTIQCPDTLGIVAAVASYLTECAFFIEESSHFGDPDSGRFFMRTAFAPRGPAFSRTRFQDGFASIAEQFDMDWAVHDPAVQTRVLVMASKLDHCLNDLLYRYRTGALHMAIPAIVSNHMDLAGLAEWHRIPFFHVPVSKNTKPQAESRLREIIDDTQAELVVLARYMQILSDDMCRSLAGQCINIHHSFLPSFKGARPYHRAFDRGVKLIGATAHYVTPELDEGPIIEQTVHPVDHTRGPKDLIAVGRDVETLTLSRAVKAHLDHRVFLNGNKTVVFR
jgi:formyltetrahydrofolate deformylase